MMSKKELREAFGSFATGVCVVSTRRDDGTAVGITINSFSSVSLEPPLLLWSIQNSSRCFDLFGDDGRFCINVLSSTQLPLSRKCAGSGGYDLDEGEWTSGSSDSPVLKQAIATFECEVWSRYPGGDHTIIIGEVKQVTAHQRESPLIFYKGAYAGIDHGALVSVNS